MLKVQRTTVLKVLSLYYTYTVSVVVNKTYMTQQLLYTTLIQDSDLYQILVSRINCFQSTKTISANSNIRSTGIISSCPLDRNHGQHWGEFNSVVEVIFQSKQMVIWWSNGLMVIWCRCVFHTRKKNEVMLQIRRAIHILYKYLPN